MAWTYHNKPPMGWPLDLSEPINKGLVGCWLMNEGAGNKVQDLSENGNTGTEQVDSVWQPGKFGPCRYFSGDDYINCGAGLSTYLPKPFTIISWFNTSAAANYATIAGRYSVSAGYRVCAFTNGRMVCYVKDNVGATKRSFTAGTYEDGKWHQIVGIWDGANVIIVMDGGAERVVGDALTTFANASAVAFEIGYDAGAVGYWTGLIDNTLVYNRALTASEIALLYRFPFYGFLNPDEVPVLDQYYDIAVAGMAGAMTTNPGQWGW